MERLSLQERYAPLTTCFGCGPANAEGLRIRSFEAGDAVIASWQPQPRHEAFAGYLNGGVIGTLLDCHANWTAAVRLMADLGADRPPATVTSELSVRFERPTPATDPVTLRARVTRSDGRRVRVMASLEANDQMCVRAEAIFVAVGRGHPAFGRW